MDKNINDAIVQSYYLSPNMIKFLLAENLALKTLLLQNNLITVNDFDECKKNAEQLLENSVNEQIEIWKRNNNQVIEKLNSYYSDSEKAHSR